MKIRLRYSNKAVTNSNTAVRKCRYTPIKQPALEHNLDFESIIMSIIGWTFEHCALKRIIGNFQTIIGSSQVLNMYIKLVITYSSC